MDSPDGFTTQRVSDADNSLAGFHLNADNRHARTACGLYSILSHYLMGECGHRLGQESVMLEHPAHCQNTHSPPIPLTRAVHKLESKCIYKANPTLLLTHSPLSVFISVFLIAKLPCWWSASFVWPSWLSSRLPGEATTVSDLVLRFQFNGIYKMIFHLDHKIFIVIHCHNCSQTSWNFE